MSLKARVDKLFSGIMSSLTANFIVSEDDKVIKEKTIGNNKSKVVTIVIKL